MNRTRRTSPGPHQQVDTIMEMYLQVAVTFDVGKTFNWHTGQFIYHDHWVTATLSALGRVQQVYTMNVLTTMDGVLSDERQDELIATMWEWFSENLITDGYVVTQELEFLSAGPTWPERNHPGYE